MEDFVKITISVNINANIEKVWEYYNDPKHIVNWKAASDDWHCPKSTNDFRDGGSFNHTMAARDGSTSFDFEGKYIEIIPLELIHYDLSDGRNIYVVFEKDGDSTIIIESFDAETENSIELQRDGWQAILDRFKGYVEALKQ